MENQKGEILPAFKKNVLSMYPKHGQAIKSFIKSQTINFTTEKHLVAPTDFISTP